MMAARAPVLVIAVGNPDRGDDALGPLLADRLAALDLPNVEVLVDFQLQVEHALDVTDRELVIFVDAGIDTPAPCEVRAVAVREAFAHTTHALEPPAVLATCERVGVPLPQHAVMLSVRGDCFALGAELSQSARTRLEAAWATLLKLCRTRTVCTPARIA